MALIYFEDITHLLSHRHENSSSCLFSPLPPTFIQVPNLLSLTLTQSFPSHCVVSFIVILLLLLLLLLLSRFSCGRLCSTPWATAYQAPPPMGFSRQEYWSGVPLPSPGDLPNPGIKPRSPTLQADALPSEPPGKSNGSPITTYLAFLKVKWNLSNLSWL